MTGAAVIRAASGGELRRVVQSGVVLGVLAFSTAAALLAIAVLTSANQGFADAFANEHEADVQVAINSAKVTSAQIQSTRRLSGVTATAGPYPEATITATTGSTDGAQSGGTSEFGAHKSRGREASAARAGAKSAQHDAGATGGDPGSATRFTVVGRPAPLGELHRIAANPSIMDAITHAHSRWPSTLGQISIAQATSIRVPLGAALTITSAPGKPKLKVVGYGSQSVLYDGGWVMPGEIPLLRAKRTPAQEEMFCSFSSAGSSAQINGDLAEVKRVLGAGAIVSSKSYLADERMTGREQSVNTPFITTFALVALVLAVLIVANVVAAAAIASYRRIGVLKSIGFTPGQVTAVYLAQIRLPAIAGAVLGAVLGNHWALPLIQMAPIPTKVSVPAWIDFTAPLGMLALTGVAAAVPALRAGRMPALQAIAAGQAPPQGRGYLAHRLSGRLPLPRPVTVGLAAPFSRPARSTITLVSITAGLLAVVMAVGLTDSIHKINHSAIQGLGQVQVTPHGVRGAPFTTSQNPTVHAALRSQPQTQHYVAESDAVVGLVIGPPGSGSGIAGLSRSQVLRMLADAPVPVVLRMPGLSTTSLSVVAYNGVPSWLGWAPIVGRWYRTGEVDASPQLLTATGKHVGQDITLTVNQRPITVRIAGEVFVPALGAEMFINSQTLGPAAAQLTVNSDDMNVKPGTNTNAYIAALTRRLGTADYFVVTPAGPSIAAQIKASYFHLLAILIAALASLGVLNSILMATRERLHDLGIYKALGMTPAQAIEMVLCWVIVPTIFAAIIALPIGLIVQDKLIRDLASTSIKLILPGGFVHVLGAGELTLLTLAGFAIAAAGALGPASWAAAAKATTALHAE